MCNTAVSLLLKKLLTSMHTLQTVSHNMIAAAYNEEHCVLAYCFMTASSGKHQFVVALRHCA